MKIIKIVQIVLFVVSVIFIVLSIVSDSKDTINLSIALGSILIVNVINMVVNIKKMKSK